MRTLLFFFIFVSVGIQAQIRPLNGVEASKPQRYALKNARIVVSPEKTIENGTIIIENDRIQEVGMLELISSDAVVIDCKGLTILSSFIDLWSSYGMPNPSAPSWSSSPQMESNKSGQYYWNEAVHPETEASKLFNIDDKASKEFQKMGFGLALTHYADGIFRGSAALVTPGNVDAGKQLMKANAASVVTFDKGVSRQSYPSSQMGSIALIRQVYYDLKWYSNASDKTTNISLDALKEQQSLPVIFETKDKWEILRAEKIAKEFGLRNIFLGCGNEYGAVESLKKLGKPIILPLNFPDAFDVKDPYVSRQIPLADMKHWELAPSNPMILTDAGIPICFTSYGQKDASGFWKNLKKALDSGFSRENAIKALTTEPAKTMGIEKDFGTLEKGMKANFTVYLHDPFEQDVVVLESWIQGERIIHALPPKNDPRGQYKLTIDGRTMYLELSGTPSSLEGKIQGDKEIKDPKSGAMMKDTFVSKVFVQMAGNDITLQFACDDGFWKGSINLHGKIGNLFGILEGDGQLPDGKWIQWSGIRKERSDDKKKETNKDELAKNKSEGIWLPNMAYGFRADELPDERPIVIQNATVWTNEENGILTNATVAVVNGKIEYVGTGYYPPPPNARVINAEGRHLTSGIIDEHSHIAISKGVNEGGQSVSAEVSIGDVVNPDDINIYRQIAGGVTAAQLLHGSANPIGGQSALIKLKWGSTPDDMLIPNAPKFIKCALGENVKQSNWGDYNTVRFPQTRMGVEQVFYDAFNRAKAYDKEWKDYQNGSVKDSTKEPRKDLELEILLEILKSKRFITCHSYVQSEINMLMHVADSVGFKVNTFTHILEGYKVADKMKEHGAGASTFSDWWAYKFEVNDAIPYNASLLHNMGVVVAINSDDAEMGRRLNQEAAKAVKYGGMSEIDAWKMVTLNPAKLLHLDDRMGSIAAGKDADLVLWTDHPLSISAKVDYTIIDGQVYFDTERDKTLRTRMEEERARLVTAMLVSQESGEPVQTFRKKKSKRFHCDTLGEEGSSGENTH